MPMVVLDSASVAREPGSRNYDRLVATQHVAAVIDGTTGKPWHAGGLAGGEVADHVAAVLTGITGIESAQDVVERMTAAVAAAKAAGECSPIHGGAAATVAAVLVGSRIVLRVGDPWVRIGQHVHAPTLLAEHSIAGARALLTEHALSTGVSVSELRRHDIGREAVLPLLRAAEELRNHPTSTWGYGAVDGGPIPKQFIEHWKLPDEVVEVTLASDGFPWLGADLASSERALAARLQRDPLMIEEAPATKASPSPEASFDDRTFLRIQVPVR